MRVTEKLGLVLPSGNEVVDIDLINDNFEKLERSMPDNGASGDAIVYTPHVSEDGTLSWTCTGDLELPDPVNIKGPIGDPGPAYTLTEADKSVLVAAVVAALPVYNGEVTTE